MHSGGRCGVRKIVLAFATMAGMVCGTVSVAHAAADIPYYKLDYNRYDYTYESEEVRARRFAFFRWDDNAYCRYRSGWNGPGAYRIGTRWKRRFGWDGGYPWQGPGTPADHEDDQAFASAGTEYVRDFRGAGECGTRVHRHHRHHSVTLHRKD